MKRNTQQISNLVPCVAPPPHPDGLIYTHILNGQHNRIKFFSLELGVYGLLAGGGGKGHGTRKFVANISSKQFESKAVLNVLMNFDDGPQKKAIHKRGGGRNFVDLPSERASDAADRNAT